MKQNKQLYINELEYLNGQIDLVKSIMRLIPIEEKKGVYIAVLLLLEGVLENLISFEMLIRTNNLRSSFIISRPILEGLVNIGYIIAEGEEMAFRAYSHSLAKSIWDFKREVKIGELTLKIGISDFSKIILNEEKKNILTQFTTKKGFEVRDWTTDSLEKRIEKIFKENGSEENSTFLLGYSFIYRHSSEFIHSTIFSSMYQKGMTDERRSWPKDINELIKYQNHRMDILLKSILLVNSYIVIYISSYYQYNEIYNIERELLTKYNRSKKTN